MNLIFFLIIIVFTLSLVVVVQQDAYGVCDASHHCYALQQTSISTAINGIEFELDSPDLWIDRTNCNDIAASAGWLKSPSTGEWLESGVTKGDFRNVGCVTQLSTYYAINTVNVLNMDNYLYQEFLAQNGRVDPGNNITVKIQKFGTTQAQIYLTTPHVTSLFPLAQVNMNSNNEYYGDFGIEGTVSAEDDYSSIPMSKFTNMKIKQGTSWINLPSSATVYTPDTSDGYLGKECRGNSFVAGSVVSLDCNVAATRNQVPQVSSPSIKLQNNSPKTISLDAVDTDKDYLIYNLIQLPSHGLLNHNNLSQKIPNTDGDSARLVYTPSSNPPVSDAIRYSVTDKREGHTREGVISIIGPKPSNAVPDSVDDFRHSLSGNVISFSWSHPDDGSSPITYYQVERSHNAINWNSFNRYSETITSFDYTRYSGYDQYFRIFAFNDIGKSPASNIVHVHINDTSPPIITIRSPENGSTIMTSDITVSGIVREPQNTGIDYIQIYVNDIIISNPVLVNALSPRFSQFESTITGIANGNHTITVKSANMDNAVGSESINITLNAHVPVTLTSFTENFQDSDIYNWHLTTEDDEFWSIRDNPREPVPNSQKQNKVIGTEDCDNICSMVMLDRVDLTQMIKPTLSFYRFVATGADVSNNEGIYVYTSADDGVSWSPLDSFTANNSQDDGIWHLHKYNLTNTSDSFKLRFDARSSSNSEDTELDDIMIFDGGVVNDIIAPSLTIPSDRTFEAVGLKTSLTNAQIGMASATDNTDTNPIISNNSTGLFLFGDTVISWNATDSSGNTATKEQTITIQDTTKPEYVSPIINYTLPGEKLVLPIPVTIPQAMDNYNIDDTGVFCNPSVLSKVGDNQIWCQAIDTLGNTNTVSFTVTVPLESMFVLENITTDTCQIQVQLGHSKVFSLDECDSEYTDVPISSISRSLYFGDVEISDNKTTVIITAPDSVDSPLELVDEFGITIGHVAHNRPTVDVQVNYYE